MRKIILGTHNSSRYLLIAGTYACFFVQIIADKELSKREKKIKFSTDF